MDKELAKHSFDYLVIGGGSVDISNLDTSVSSEANIDNLKADTITSASQLFCIAEASLHEYGQLKKVVLLNRTPRFDPISSDQLKLKPQLSKLANSVFFDLWCNSKFRDRIVIGEHNLPMSQGEEHSNLYGHPLDKDMYDGVHLRGQSGRSTLSSSILEILKKAQICKEKNIVPTGWKITPNQEKNIHQGRKTSHEYDPMKAFLQSNRKKSSNVPEGWTNASRQERNQTQSQNLRPSVIHPNTSKSQLPPSKNTQEKCNSNDLPFSYSVPTYNLFSNLGN